MNQLPEWRRTNFDYKHLNSVQVKHQSSSKLAGFSFLVCFALLMLNWYPEIDGAGSFFLTTGFALLVSLVGWIFVAVLLRLALFLPANTICRLDWLASLCYAAAFGILLYSLSDPGDGVFDLLVSMALSALLAFPCSLVLRLPLGVLADLLGLQRKRGHMVASRKEDPQQILPPEQKQLQQ